MLLSNQPVSEWPLEWLPNSPLPHLFSSVSLVCLTWAESGHIPTKCSFWKGGNSRWQKPGCHCFPVPAAVGKTKWASWAVCSPSAIPGRLGMLGMRLVPTFNLSWSCFLGYSSALQMATRPGQDLGRWFMSSPHLTNDAAPRLGKWRKTQASIYLPT